LKVKNVRSSSPAVITLHGKGDKTRQVPILGKTKELLKDYLEDHKKHNWGVTLTEAPLFFNQRQQALSRWGVSYILNKYVRSARNDRNFMIDFPVRPHVLRHTKGMGMIKAVINLIYILDFLGHSSVMTTEIYADIRQG